MTALSQDAEALEKTAHYLAQQQSHSAIASAELAKQMLAEIMAHLTPGMRESEARQFALDCFARHGIERTWHAPYVRFGANTLLTFREHAKADLVLGERDIAFVDIGIVHEGIEGDAGASRAFGDQAEHHRIANASEAIFHEAVAFWEANNPVGVALYEHILALAEKLDVAWNLDPAGHLIGAFPHRGWKRGINHYPKTVESGKWILEIQIKHKSLPFGAFYEDLLYNS